MKNTQKVSKACKEVFNKLQEMDKNSFRAWVQACGWSEITPDIEGWYWIHFSSGLSDINYIYENKTSGEMMIGLHDNVECKKLESEFDVLYHGPIIRPELPTNKIFVKRIKE